MPEVTIPNNWIPRADQMPLWSYLENGGKRAVEVAHRRWGKDDVALHRTAVAAHERVGNYWHMLPEAEQARKAIWTAINPHTGIRRIDEAFPHIIRETTREQEMFIKFKSGSTWQVVGSDNFRSLLGSPPIGVVFSEWSLANPEAWAQLLPILTENDGWAIFIYTPKGNNHGKSMLDFAKKESTWFWEVLPIEKTKLIPQSVLDETLRAYQSLYGDDDGQAYYDQEFGCSFAAPLIGSYFGPYVVKARGSGRIGSVPHRLNAKVWTGWDMGRGDDTVIWFAQRIGPIVCVIDYYKASGYTMDHYAKVLRDKPYVYAGHLMPHDAGRRVQHAPRSLDEQLKDFGFDNVKVLPQSDKKLSHDAGRRLISIAHIDAEKCRDGLAALESYHRQWDDDRKVFRDTPYHDWASHPSDAWCELAKGLEQESDPLEQPVRVHMPRIAGGWMR